VRQNQVDFAQAVLHVRRAKNGTPSTHPLTGREMRALRRLRREASPSPFMFVSERGAPFSTAGFARMLERAAVSARLDIKVHPHMLRHACGYALANQGRDTRGLQSYLGSANRVAKEAVSLALATYAGTTQLPPTPKVPERSSPTIRSTGASSSQLARTSNRS